MSKWGGLASVLLLSAACFLSACSTTGPVGGQGVADVYTRYIRDGAAAPGQSVSLIPPFRTGMIKRNVEAALRGSGYRLVNTGIMPPREGEPSLGVWQKELGKGYQTDPCAVRYNITVHFDGTELLMAAEGHWVDAGCQ